jgi:hypothetical protein
MELMRRQRIGYHLLDIGLNIISVGARHGPEEIGEDNGKAIPDGLRNEPEEPGH